MSPAIAPPPTYRTPTASAAIIIIAPAFAGAQQGDVTDPDFPHGIDYERWSSVVQPAAREAFADRLDLIDLFDD